MIRRIFLSLFASLILTATSAFGLEPGRGRDVASPRPMRIERAELSLTPKIFFDKTRFASARAVVKDPKSFPNLGEDFEVVDPIRGMKYNCIAHSLGIHSHWVNPKTGPAERPYLHMDSMYTAKGYTRVNGLDFKLNTRMKKVALYAKVSNGKVTEVTHAALQETDGSWSSKLGQLPLIRHTNPQALNGPTYGQPVAVYVKHVR